MNLFNALKRELMFSLRERTLWLWMVVITALAWVSIGFGLAEVERQKATVQRLIETDQQDRLAESKKFKDWGSTAYYNFHITYDAPSHFAFAAMGQRDQQPWIHRIRMLALEGQIYERDVGNPSVALIGRFDFAFFTAFIMPLIIIMLLYDLKSSEQTAGRYNLIQATALRPKLVWALRAFIRVSFAYFCAMTPVIVAGLFAGSGFKILFLACVAVALFTIFWGLLCYFFVSKRQAGPITLMALISVWLLTAVVIPAGARMGVDHLVPLPAGADILMLQRETVNDAWDIPRETTMNAFFERHRQWSHYQPAGGGFEWPWYYAFQQVGDQKTEPLANAYREGRLKRDQITAWISMFLPPSLLERTLQSLANTDLKSTLNYEANVRAFHAQLREFYYPKFFLNEPFDPIALKSLPRYQPLPTPKP